MCWWFTIEEDTQTDAILENLVVDRLPQPVPSGLVVEVEVWECAVVPDADGEEENVMLQLIFHLWGDYLLQSDWMAQNKTKRNWPAVIHALLYALPFVLISCRPERLIQWPVLAIIVSHFFIDRFRLARYLVWAKNFMAPVGSVPPRWDGQEQQSHPRRNWDWAACKDTCGYAPDSPAFMHTWLMIIADNTIHLTINYLALRFL